MKQPPTGGPCIRTCPGNEEFNLLNNLRQNGDRSTNTPETESYNWLKKTGVIDALHDHIPPENQSDGCFTHSKSRT